MILIAPWAKKLRVDKPHPKNYPYWPEVIQEIKEPIIQVGVKDEVQLVDDFRKNLSINELSDLVKQCKTWLSVDSFFQHFCWDLGKPGIAIWGPSDPLIFGHPENVNLLKDRSYLRPNQFWWWEQCDFNKDAFVEPKVVLDALQKFINN
jgi:ADP-heptose:LPS heptosyltransferase